MDAISCRSYGKINLMLNISGKREDGYHNIETVMQTVSLYDAVTVSLKKQRGIKVSCNLPYIPCDSRNVAYKAAEVFFGAAKINCGADISIKKTIPVGGGMGGGSANAATVLNGLNALCGRPLDKNKLHELAYSLGADVPFCLERGTFLAEGIGEKLTRLPDMPKCSIVVCKPRASVSSRTAYQIYDDFEVKNNYDSAAMVRALEKGDINMVAKAMGNSFEEPISAEYPEIPAIKKQLLENGAMAAAMTGSGSVVFGLFKNAGRAHMAKNVLRLLGYRTYCVSPVNE